MIQLIHNSTRCRWSGLLILVGMMLFVCGPNVSVAQQTVSNYDATPETIQEVYANKDAYVGRSVRLPIPAYVTTVDAASRAETRSYTVKDASGTGIQVFTPGTLPEVNGEYEIHGRVEQNASGSPYVFETRRTDCTGVFSSCGGGGLTDLLIFGIIGLFVVVVGLGVYVMTRPEEEEPVPAGEDGPSGGPGGKTSSDTVETPTPGGDGSSGPQGGRPGPQQDGGMGGTGGFGGAQSSYGGVPGGGRYENETVVMNLAPQKTAKMLGRLTFVDSDEDPIPLNVPIDGGASGGKYHTFTVGRRDPSSKSDYSHIKLKPRTVSRQQAKLVHQEGRFYVTNLVSEKKNPTRVNDEPMGEGERRELDDGDLLQMGEVKLRFHSA